MDSLSKNRIYPLPPVLPGNPYLDLLYDAMGEVSGQTVRRVRPVWRGWLEAARAGGRRILHLHFFDELCQRPSRLETRLRIGLFKGLVRALQWRGVRLVWTVHNIAPHEPHHPVLAHRLYQWLFVNADAVIAHSAGAAAEIRRRYDTRSPIHVIPHGNYIGVYGPQVAQLRAREALGYGSEPFLFASVGTLRRYKGLEMLIEAYRSLSNSETRLLIAGSAKSPIYLQTLREQTAGASGIDMRAKYIPEEEMPLYAAAADVIVLPYTRVLTSGVLLWAMSYGRPVIAPRSDAISDLLIDGETGFVFDPDQPDNLKLAMLKAVERRDELKSMGRAGLARVSQRNWRSIAEQTADVYACTFPTGQPDI